MSELRRAIAIDFDGCLCKNMWPNIGLPNFDAINAAIRAKQEGAALILWTCRIGEKLENAIQFCKNYGLEFDAVNENLPERMAAYNADPRKVNADEYWGDLAVFVSADADAGHGWFAGGPGDDSIKIIKPSADGDDSLEACPFCGGTEAVYELYGNGAGERWRCWCTNCLASIDPGWAQDRHTVRDMWNRRPAQLNVPLTLEELREMEGEPVWVDGALYHMDPSCGGLWGIVTLMNDGIVFGDMDLMPLKDIVGFAYRCKPEEGDKNA